jgi:hypothetical protein
MNMFQTLYGHPNKLQGNEYLLLTVLYVYLVVKFHVLKFILKFAVFV